MSMMEYTSASMIVTLDDSFDTHSVSKMRAFLEDIVNNPKRDNVVLDASEVVFLDSSGIGALVFLYKRLAEKGRSLHIVGLAGQPADIIRTLRIDRTLKTHESLNIYLAQEQSITEKTSAVSYAKPNKLQTQN
ncbi:MAG: STAS domain-containing protein [Pseudomonadota bacterium]